MHEPARRATTPLLGQSAPGTRTVRLVGGPADGQVIDNYRGGPVLVHSDEEAGLVARYRPTRDKSVLRFREWDRIVASIPALEDHT